MAIQLYDSLTRQLRPLAPADGKTFRMYCCGPTVYGPAHIGNFRTFILQDVLRRVLELEGKANGWTVKHVRNFTDVDDRTIGQVMKERRSLNDITRHWTEKFHQDCAALNLQPPHVEPTATGHIAEQVTMIEELMAKGHAYVAADGSVYFKIGSHSNYGALSRVKERELKVTDADAASDHKDSLGDFALWKAHKPEEDGAVKWPGPKGAADGRPGWHIECSAMSRKHLGDTIDLHGGGVDLLFPHHENEIAQSEGCTGRTFAHHWWHTEHLLVDGKKMSKSLGNLYTLDDLMAKGFSPMAVRYALLSGHPRKQMNFTLDSLHAAEKALATLRAFRTELPLGEGATATFDAVFAALNDDLNLPGALGALFTVVNRGAVGASAAGFDRVTFVLGLDLAAKAREAEVPAALAALAEQRWAAKKIKDFATADKLRAEIQAAGWQMLDGRDGYKLEPAKK